MDLLLIKISNLEPIKKFLKIGYFGSIYKSRGYKLIIELAKLDKKNKYFIYGNINNKKFIQKK